MSYLKIANVGELEVEALTLLGASSKRGSNDKIGMFGSGNKYALAYFLRNGNEVQIFSGSKKIDISLSKKVFRDTEFSVVCINGKETSITTEFGYDWKLWQAIRELYSNAVDEGLADFREVGDICPENGQTHIYITYTDEIEKLMFDIKDYIAKDKKVLFECEHGKIYEKHSNKACIYRKGIRCYDTGKQTIFDYDFEDIDINESRVAAYSWAVPESIWKLINKCDDLNIIRKVLFDISNDKELLENDIDDQFVTDIGSFNQEVWSQAVADKLVVPRNLGGYLKDGDRVKALYLPSKLYNRIAGSIKKENTPDSFTVTEKGIPYKEADMTSEQARTLESVLTFFNKAEFDISYKIKVVNFDSKTTHGTIEGDTILIGTNCIDKGAFYTANTIIEEHIHLKSGAGDETRAFQEASIDLLIGYMKKVKDLTL